MLNNRNCARSAVYSFERRQEGNSGIYRDPSPDVRPAIPFPCKRCNITGSDGRGWCIGPCLPWRHHDA
jgi:hypothetical protein